MRFLTAGESHGPALVAIIEGFPAKVPVTQEAIDGIWPGANWVMVGRSDEN